MRNIKKIGAHFAPAIAYGDVSGLSDDDEIALDKWFKCLPPLGRR